MRRKTNRAFTMVELLVVVAIIGLIAGLLLPVVNKVRLQARKVTASEDVQQIVSAWKGYLNDQRQFPTVEVSEMNTNIVAILAHTSAYANVYMEFTKAEQEAGFRDPWGRLYRVLIDNGVGTNETEGGGYDGLVWPDGPDGDPVRKVVAAWSLGPSTNDANDDIRSW